MVVFRDQDDQHLLLLAEGRKDHEGEEETSNSDDGSLGNAVIQCLNLLVLGTF